MDALATQPLLDTPWPHRVGRPAPLPFHISAALGAAQGAIQAAPLASTPGIWHPALPPPPPEPVAPGDVAIVALRRLSAFFRGITRWQHHPFRREDTAVPVIWRDGGTRLLDFGSSIPDAPPVLVVPSLINRAYVLDLLPDRSMLGWLSGQGLRPILLDWGPPGEAERDFDIDTYGSLRLIRAADAVSFLTGQTPALMGYCMGGTLVTGLAARQRGRFPALVTLGAPWHFTEARGVSAGLRAWGRQVGPAFAEAVLAASVTKQGLLSEDLFQLLFAMIDPLQAARKFRHFADVDPASPAARRFVALEDWLADAVPMAWPAARDLLIGWQLEGTPAAGRWRFLGGPVRAERCPTPALVVTGTADSIAPPEVAGPLAEALPNANHLTPPTGHVGMIVSGIAQKEVWEPVRDFLLMYLKARVRPSDA